MNNHLLYAATVLIWGSTWIVINYQLGSVSPSVSLAYRFGLASLVLMTYCLVTRRSLSFDAKAHGTFILMGLLLFGINYMAAYWAQVYINSAFNALVFASMVWLNILFSRVFFGVKPEAVVYLGALLGMIGVCTLFWPELRNLSLANTTLLGAGISSIGALSASLGNMLSQRSQRRALPVVQSNAWGMFYGTGFYAILAWLTGANWTIEPSAAYMVSLLYLSIFGTVVGFSCYLTLLGRIGAHKSGYAVVMFPVVAVVLSVLFEGLHASGHVVAGVVLVILGNLAVLWKKTPSERSP